MITAKMIYVFIFRENMFAVWSHTSYNSRSPIFKITARADLRELSPRAKKNKKQLNYAKHSILHTNNRCPIFEADDMPYLYHNSC